MRHQHGSGWLDGEEIEEDELHIASLEADADEDFGGEKVGDLEFEEEFRDNRTGENLDPELVAKARSEEVEFMAKIGLYKEVDITECLEMTGRPPISTRWVDVNKGSTESPDVRCRLAARDFKPKGEKDRSDIFAAMPPLEAKNSYAHPDSHSSKFFLPTTHLRHLDIRS